MTTNRTRFLPIARASCAAAPPADGDAVEPLRAGHR